MPKLDLTGPRPPYVTIADNLLAAILDGTYSPGDRLPPITTLAQEYDVAPGTVQSALGLLRDWSITATRRGTGTFVRDDLDVSAVRASLPPVGSAGDSVEILRLLNEIRDRVDELGVRLGAVEDRLAEIGR